MASAAPSALIPVGGADHVVGAEEPELTLVEYGDFGCPFCFAASRPVKWLLERYDTLRMVWRHFPDSEFHPGADLAAELSELAADGGASGRRIRCSWPATSASRWRTCSRGSGSGGAKTTEGKTR